MHDRQAHLSSLNTYSIARAYYIVTWRFVTARSKVDISVGDPGTAGNTRGTISHSITSAYRHMMWWTITWETSKWFVRNAWNWKHCSRYLFRFCLAFCTWYSTLLLRASDFASKTTTNIALHIERWSVFDFSTRQHAGIVWNTWQWLTIFNSSRQTTLANLQASFLFQRYRYSYVCIQWNHVCWCLS